MTGKGAVTFEFTAGEKSYLLSENRTDDTAENKEIKAPHPTNASISIKKNKEHSKYIFNMLAGFCTTFFPLFPSFGLLIEIFSGESLYTLF